MLKSVGVVGITAAFLLLGMTVPAYSRQEQQEKSKNEERQQQQDRPAEKQQQSAKPARQEPPQANKQQSQQPQKQSQANAQKNSQRQPAHQTPDNSAKQRQAKSQKQEAQGNSVKKPQQQAQGQQSQPQHQQSQPQQARVQQDQQHQRPQQQDNRSAGPRSADQVHQQQVAWQGDRAHDWKTEHRTWQQRGGYSGYRVPDARFRADYGQDHAFRIYNLPVMFAGGIQRFQYGGYWFGLVDPWPEYWPSDWYDSDDVYIDFYAGGYYLYNREYPGDRIAISFYLN